MSFLLPYAISILSGHFYSLGFPSYLGESLVITPILGMALLWLNIFQTRSLKKRLFYIALFQLSFTLTSFYWIPKTLSEFGGLPLFLGWILNLLFSLISIPWLSAVLILLFLLKRHEDKLFKSSLFPLVFSFGVTLLEYFVPEQFPTHIAGPLIVLSEYLSFAPMGGLPLYSFFSYLLIFSLAQGLLLKKMPIRIFSYVGIFIFLHFIFSNESIKKEIPLSIRMVQANISNFLKMDSELGEASSTTKVIERYKELSLSGDKDFDLIIWPETAYPFSLNSKEPKNFPYLFNEIMSRKNAELFIGGYDEKDYPLGDYNSGFFFSDQKISQTYHKRILIPFGETLPFGPLNEFIKPYVSTIAFFSIGKEFPLIHLKNGLTFIGAICYEILKPEYLRDYLNSLNEKRPSFIMNLTNDSWYGDTVEPYQHLFLLRWRAIEFKLPILRSTNTGITAYINDKGVVEEKLLPFVTGNLDLNISFSKSNHQKTLFQQFGFLTTALIFFILLILEGTMLKFKNVKHV